MLLKTKPSRVREHEVETVTKVLSIEEIYAVMSGFTGSIRPAKTQIYHN